MSDNVSQKNYHSGHRERVRERFDADPEMLTFKEHEMLEFLLNTVIPRKDTNVIAHELIAKNGSLYGVFNAGVQDLLSVKNMTVGAAYLLAGIIPIVRKALRMSGEDNMKKVINYGDAADFFHTFFMARNTECLCVLFLGVKYKILKTMIVDDLNPSSVTFNVRNIAASAVKCGAKYIIAGHNHPSGSPMPSEDDFMLIWHLFNVLAGLDINLLDNFIFTETGFLSFRNVGILHKFALEYNLRNPARLLKEDNKSVSLYVSNLNQYLINVTQLKQENLMELITVDEFIKRNRPQINDVREEKSDFKKDDGSRQPYQNQDNKFDMSYPGEKKALLGQDDEQIKTIADEVTHGDLGEYQRKSLHKIDISKIYDADKVEELSKSSGTAGKTKTQPKLQNNNAEKIQPRKIKASTRNIPEFIFISDRKDGKR